MANCGPHTFETRERLSTLTKQSWLNTDLRNQRINSMQGAGQGDPKAIVTPHGSFDSVTEAALSMSVSRMTLYKRLKNFPETYYYKK